MEASRASAKLCKVCSKLDIQRLTHPLHPCRDPLPCSTPPINHIYGSDSALGSIDEIKSRRSTCDICRLVAESLDKEPSDLDGGCRIIESAEFCNFRLPTNVKARDPSVTHFHLTQASVIFDTSEANQFQGPSLPWELKVRDIRSSHYILNFQVSRNRVLTMLMLTTQIQVKARSGAEAGDMVAAYLKTEQEFLGAIGGRYVATQANIQLIRAWLHQCESKHRKDCMPSLRLSPEGDREPTFVIDVIQSCLVDTPSRCRYVALSYVWGTAPVFTHLLENTQDLRKTSSLRSLPIPLTIRDAITLVHAIGERYLWVDSLCIVQDDWKMKGAEIMRMGSIYSRALFTIIAAAGDHANSGLPGVEQGTREQVQKILKLANCELLTVIDVRKTPSGIDGTKWAQRAWTFQERVLSNRVLVFSESQVYWSCRVASHSEERALEEVRDIDQRHLSFPQKFPTDCLPSEPLQRPLEYRNLYDDLLFTYQQRRMTYKTDILNAFNGISEILAALQNDTFLWGLPESLFSYAVTWFFTGHSARNYVNIPFERNGCKEMVPIPSWSWAAWSGDDPDNLRFHAGDGSHVRPVIDFDLVDRKHQLVRIKERSWPDLLGDRPRALWKNEPLHQVRSPTQHSPFRTGQLRFWTSLANVRAVRRWRVAGPGAVEYALFPSPDFQPDSDSTHYHSEIVQQDFIVVAAGAPKTLILLAIEWKDGVAYREGKTVVGEAEWVGVENRQWRLITLG
jgi:hypothetical protein